MRQLSVLTKHSKAFAAMNRPILLLTLFALVICSCEDDVSRPASMLDTRVPVYGDQWELDVFSFALDDNGALHVAQFFERDVLDVSAEGAMLGSWYVILGTDTVSTSSLTCVGSTFVTLSFDNIVILDANHTVVSSWPEKHSRFFSSGGDLIDADAVGNIYVLDDNRDLVVKYTSDGQFEREWRVGAPDSLGTGGVAGIAVANEGLVFVADAWRHRILTYNTKGALIRTFGKFGDRPGQLDGPRGLDVSTGVLYVADTLNFRIQKFTLTGYYLANFYSRGMYGQGLDPPESVDVDGNKVFVMHENSIIRFDYVD